MRSILYFFFLLLTFLFSAGEAISQKTDADYGLAFASHEVSKDHRTGLNLNPDEAFRINRDFTLKFDFALQRLINAYGYVVRVIANDTLNVDLMTAPEHNEFSDLTLVINNKPTQLHFEFNDVRLKEHVWTTLTIGFSFTRNEITLDWNGHIKTQPYPLKNLDRFRFYFGVNNSEKFSTTDAPPCIIRDISINTENKVYRKWLLKTHHHTEVFDSVDHERAEVQNPSWLIDKRTHWTHRKHFTTGRFPSVAFRDNGSLLYITDEKNLYSYALSSDALSVKKNTSGTPVHSDANQLLYIQEKDRLVNYDLFTNKLFSYNFIRNEWNNQDTTYFEPNYWHHNKFYNHVDSAVYVFGGYGHFTYRNSFFRFDKGQQKWLEVKVDGFIPPRYLAASGERKSTGEILIMGGYGSESGKQELSPQSFYDLYTFNLKDHAVRKVRDYSSPGATEDHVFSNSLVVNDEQECFYVLSYPKNKYENFIRLWQYSLTDATSGILADSIPFRFHDEDSFCDLFLSGATHELVAVTVHQDKQQYQVDVYSINYPPLKTQDVLQPVNSYSATSPVVIVCLIAISIFLIAFGIYRQRGKKLTQTVPVAAQTPPSSAATAGVTTVPISEEPRHVSAVLLFGGFQVFDKQGVDISSRFTMTLKELFALILLHSIKFENGISAPVIQEYLWPDKDEVSARNNRNVNIKKLRTLLEEIGGISVDNNNSYLKLNMEDHVVCDYQIVYKLLNHEGQQHLAEPEKIQWLIRYVKRGSLLPNMQSSWLDNFKSDISNQIIDTLLDYSQKLDRGSDDKLLLEIADAVFTYDTINQEALVIKCSVLNKKGKYSLAKTWYDHFVKEYKNLYAENYPRTFDEVIS
jgi:two-component SAPR family response regulator